MKEIDFDKLQAEFEQALADYDPEVGPRGLTTREWAKVWKVSFATAQEWLHGYIDEGLMEFMGRATRIGIDGVGRKTPVYAPVSSEPASISKNSNVSDP